MGVTAIKSIANLQEVDLYLVKNIEHPSDTGGKHGALVLEPGDDVPCNMWIPWCTSQADFNAGHKIIIMPISADSSAVRMTVWQDGDYVRYSKDGQFHKDGDLVPGNNTVNGDRSVQITGSSVEDADIMFY